MFSFDEEEFESLKDDDEYMKKLKKDIEELNNDTEFYQWMTDEEDIVRNMKKENLSIETIKKVTGLSIEQINEIS